MELFQTAIKRNENDDTFHGFKFVYYTFYAGTGTEQMQNGRKLKLFAEKLWKKRKTLRILLVTHQTPISSF